MITNTPKERKCNGKVVWRCGGVEKLASWRTPKESDVVHQISPSPFHMQFFSNSAKLYTSDVSLPPVPFGESSVMGYAIWELRQSASLN